MYPLALITFRLYSVTWGLSFIALCSGLQSIKICQEWCRGQTPKENIHYIFLYFFLSFISMKTDFNLEAIQCLRFRERRMEDCQKKSKRENWRRARSCDTDACRDTKTPEKKYAVLYIYYLLLLLSCESC